MSVSAIRTALLVLAVAVVTAWAGAVSAQSQPIPPEHYTLDPRGVDLVSGSFNHGTTEVVIGQPERGTRTTSKSLSLTAGICHASA